MKCKRSVDSGKMFEVPDGLSVSAAATSCAAIKREYSNVAAFQDSYLKDSKGAITRVRCLSVVCNKNGVGAEGTAVEVNCASGAKTTAVVVNGGETQATATASCLLLATAYPVTTSDAYWIAFADKESEEKECKITRSATTLNVEQLGLLGSEARPASSCKALGVAYKSWSTERTGKHWVGDSKTKTLTNCIFTSAGVANVAPDGKTAESAYVSCNVRLLNLNPRHPLSSTS